MAEAASTSTSREEFVPLSLISTEVRGNFPWEASHWLTLGVWRGGRCVAVEGGASWLLEGYPMAGESPGAAAEGITACLEAWIEGC
ncbi:Udp-Glucuronosyltransferase 2A1 [Manis pentadactyla]|nr:Udp-Glucuronosyltransferase 2A1 [Manis pentadactyla]